MALNVCPSPYATGQTPRPTLFSAPTGEVPLPTPTVTTRFVMPSAQMPPDGVLDLGPLPPPPPPSRTPEILVGIISRSGSPKTDAIWIIARPIGVVLSIGLFVGIEGDVGSIEFGQGIRHVENAAPQPGQWATPSEHRTVAVPRLCASRRMRRAASRPFAPPPVHPNPHIGPPVQRKRAGRASAADPQQYNGWRSAPGVKNTSLYSGDTSDVNRPPESGQAGRSSTSSMNGRKWHWIPLGRTRRGCPRRFGPVYSPIPTHFKIGFHR